MNQLTTLPFETLQEILANVAEHGGILRLREVVDRFDLPTPNGLILDRPDVWERGFLEVVSSRDFDASMDQAEASAETISWTNYLPAGSDWYVLVPNYDVRWQWWGVLAFDEVLGVARPVFFQPDAYVGTFWPSSPCITSRGRCRNVSCDDPTHSCQKRRGDSGPRGGRYFWCECG